MASTSGSSSIWLCWAITMPNAAPTRPSPTITRTSAGQPPRATNGASQARPPASARQRFCWRAVGLPPDQRRTGTGERHRPEQLRADSPARCSARSTAARRRARPGRAACPSRSAAAARRWSRMPARLAASRPGAAPSDSGGSSSQRAPYASTPMNWKSSRPRRRSGSPAPASRDAGPARCRRRRARRPRRPGWRAVGRRAPRRRLGVGGAGSVAGDRRRCRRPGDASAPSGPATVQVGSRRRLDARSESVAVMMSLPSHAFRSDNQQGRPRSCPPEGAIGGGP